MKENIDEGGAGGVFVRRRPARLSGVHMYKISYFVKKSGGLSGVFRQIRPNSVISPSVEHWILGQIGPLGELRFTRSSSVLLPFSKWVKNK